MPMDVLSTRRVAEAMECTQDADDLSILVNVRKANAILAANRATWANILSLGATKTANMSSDAAELSCPAPVKPVSYQPQSAALSHQEMMTRLLRDPKFWDKGKEFVSSLQEDLAKYGKLTVNQGIKLQQTYDRHKDYQNRSPARMRG